MKCKKCGRKMRKSKDLNLYVCPAATGVWGASKEKPKARRAK